MWLSTLRVLVGVILTATVLDLPAQKAPKRLDTKSVADTNDAVAYIDYGLMNFDREPERALSAFYWASRIDPGNADALYGRWASTIVNDRRLLKTYMEGGRRAREDKDLRKVDSLQLRALMLNPFLHRRFDRRMLKEWVRQTDLMEGGRGGPELMFIIDRYLQSAGPATRGDLAYGDGEFAQALTLYAMALKSARYKAGLLADRARIFASQNATDSAIVNFQGALDELRQQDAKEKVSVYISKAQFEYSIALLQEARDHRDLAREAYGRALQEDLAFHPAHTRLGLLALTLGDTTSAVSELDLAAQAAPNDPFVRYQNGFVLASIGRRDQALVELRKAAELEPLYALPHFQLALLLEAGGDAAGARASYGAYLQRASLRAPQRADAERRITALAGK